MESKKEFCESMNIKQELNKGQAEAYECAMKGDNLFITGGPGTGKSFLTKALIKEFKNMCKSVLVMAPTGIAAVNIGGTTIHRALGLKRGELINEDKKGIRGKKCPLLDNADVILIDEISMVRIDLFEFVVRCIQSSERRLRKTIQLIVVGDFFQLPPVMQPEAKALLERHYDVPIGRGYCFTSKEWSMCGFKTVILSESVRQKDEAFITALNKLRLGDKSCMTYLNHRPRIDEKYPYLVSTNEQAEIINKRKVEELGRKFKQEPRIFLLESEGMVKASDLVVPHEIALYPGTRIMMVVNDVADRYQNGTCGTVAKIYKNGFVDVHLDNGSRSVCIKPYTWKVMQSVVAEDGTIKQEECGSYTQLPLKLAYAITIHKSQGQTYDAVNIDPECWEVAQLYVALSRVKTPDGVHLMRPVQRSSIIVDQSVVDFYKILVTLSTKEEEIIEQEVLKSNENKAIEKNLIKDTTTDKVYLDKKKKQKRVGRPSPFMEGTKRIRVGADTADYIQEICKKQAVEGGKIRLLPEELDICISDVLDDNVDYSSITFMAVPLELEGIFRREIKKFKNNK